MGKKLKDFGMITESEFTGRTLEIATKKAEDDGFTIRIVEKDGQMFMLTMDFRADRINFRIRNNIVTAAYGG
jgi:hypothetical protein